MLQTEGQSDRNAFGSLSLNEARTVHNSIMEYMFKSKHRLVPEEASIMGEFISSGIAIGFAVGVTVALIARKHPLTRRHPNLIGLAAAGTADALSRDYRRPVIYEKLLKLDTPLAMKGKEILFGLRSGREQNEYPIDNRTGEERSHAITSVSSVEPSVTVDSKKTIQDWWSDEPSEDQTLNNVHPSPSRPNIVTVSPVFGTRTWNDVRQETKKD
jgi:hypothetical protein